jgi:plasmid maintenance system antidote protein VapI
MINISIDQGKVERLKQSLGKKAHRLPREIQTAINATARKVASETAKDLAKILPLKQKTLKKIVKQKSKATADNLRAVVSVGEGYPIPLRMFKPTQLKRGVSVKMRRGQSRSIVRDAWIARQWGNHVYKRTTAERLPIEKQFGPSPGEYYGQLGTKAKAEATARAELQKQIERRIRFNVLKNQGTI